MKKAFFSCVVLIFLFSKTGFPLKVAKVIVTPLKKEVLLSAYLGDVPFQLCTLTLKAGESQIFFSYEIQIYKKRFLIPDKLLKSYELEKILKYDPVKNLYELKSSNWEWWFENPEKAILTAMKIEGFDIPKRLSSNEYIELKVKLFFKSKLNPDLTSRRGFKVYEFDAEKRIDEVFKTF